MRRPSANSSDRPFAWFPQANRELLFPAEKRRWCLASLWPWGPAFLTAAPSPLTESGTREGPRLLSHLPRLALHGSLHPDPSIQYP